MKIEKLIEWLRSDAIPRSMQNGCNEAASLIENTNPLKNCVTCDAFQQVDRLKSENDTLSHLCDNQKNSIHHLQNALEFSKRELNDARTQVTQTVTHCQAKVEEVTNQLASRDKLIELLRGRLAGGLQTKIPIGEQLIEACYLATMDKMEEKGTRCFIENQLQAARIFFMQTKGWNTSGTRDRDYFEMGFTSGYAGLLGAVGSGTVDPMTLIALHTQSSDEQQKRGDKNGD